MKKFFIILLLLCINVFAQSIDRKTIDDIALSGLKSKFNILDKDKVGLWYLQYALSSIYDKVRNDEFALQDEIQKAYKLLKIRLNTLDNIGKQYSVSIEVEIGKYDFQKQGFPIKYLMNSDSYIPFSGDKLVGYEGLELKFDNTNSKNHFLPMDKTKARNFIESRKDRWGYVDRSLIAKYTFIIKKIVVDPTDILNLEPLQGVKVIGHIKQLSILDKNGNLLYEYKNYK